MTLTSKLKGAAIGALLGAPGDRALHAVAAARRRLARAPRQLDFYYDPGDAWSHLAAQATARLARAYPVDVAFHVVTAPAADVDPAPDLRRVHAARDARDLAGHLDLEFPAKGYADPAAIKKAAQVLIRDRPFAEQIEVAIALGAALWASDGKAVTRLMGAHGFESQGDIAPALNASYTELRKRGFYQAASWSWDGEWYAGVDRVPYLEAALTRATGESPPPVIAHRAEPPEPARLTAVAERPVVDFWFSFRSPYSYLALGPVAELAARWPIDLRIRPVLPMVTRGLAVPTQKRLYIVRDAKREADRRGVPFGHICDPLGKGVDHAMAIAKYAIDAGRGLDFLASAARGTWSEALDLASYVDLRTVVERAGLDWDAARAAITDDDGWREWAKDAAADLAVAGLWGVPSFRVGDYATWGQDRVDLLDDRLRRHFAAPAGAPATE
jgi:2-hydroxychromene-2-carboxylate isomerase